MLLHIIVVNIFRELRFQCYAHYVLNVVYSYM